jgi:DNA-binding transcriptional LysR family regulator
MVMDRLLSMRVFQTVIDEGGFAAAARGMDLSPAAVTRLVTDLEQHLGVRLIQRTTRKLALTDAGQAYLLRVRSILSEVDDAEAAATQSSSELQGVVNIVAPSLFATYFLAAQVTEWVARYPQVAMHVHVDPFPQNRIEEFDVTFMVVDEGFDANVVARSIAKTEHVVCASPDYLRRRGTPLQPQDLLGHQYLRFAGQASSGQPAHGMRLLHTDGTQEHAGTPMQVVFQAENYETLFSAAVRGAGIAALPKFPASRYFASGELVHLLPEWIFGRYTMYVAALELFGPRWLCQGSAEQVPCGVQLAELVVVGLPSNSSHQRRFLHGFKLFFQHVNLAFPVVAAAEPRKVDREDRVFPALGQPGAVVDQAQRAQRLNQGQLAAVEFAELFVAINQCAQLPGALRAVTRKQHPQVLHRRAAARIVEVDKMRARAFHAFGGPQNVAGVAVAVQAQGTDVSHAFKHGLRRQHGLFKGFVPARAHVQRQVVTGGQNIARSVAKGLQVQRWPV